MGFREFFFCVLSVKPDRAKWGEKFLRQSKGPKAKSLHLAGWNGTPPELKVKAGDSIPAHDMAIGSRGKTPVKYARP